MPIPNDPPTVDTNSLLTVNEGAAQTITNSFLETTDTDNTTTELVYKVTTVPTEGSLKLSGSPLVLNSTFTQDDIDNNRLSYNHSGSETTSDSFDFEVTDGVATVSGQTFNISVTPVNDAPVPDPIGNQPTDEPTARPPGIPKKDTLRLKDAVLAMAASLSRT